MAENEGGGDSKFMTGFLVGFVVGVLICVGVGGTFALVGIRSQRSMAVTEARMVAEMERDRAEVAAAEARRAADRLRQAEALLPPPQHEEDPGQRDAEALPMPRVEQAEADDR
jgi:hypothetical protein